MCHQAHRDLGPKLAVGVHWGLPPQQDRAWGGGEAWKPLLCVCAERHTWTSAPRCTESQTHVQTHIHVLSSDTERPDTANTGTGRHTCTDMTGCIADSHTHPPPKTQTQHTRQTYPGVFRLTQTHTRTHTQSDMEPQTQPDGRGPGHAPSTHRAPHKVTGRLTAHRPIPALLWIPCLVTRCWHPTGTLCQQ